MTILVKKFGGSSLATPERITSLATSVAAEVRAGHRVVVVVSAMQGETDRLLGLANAVATLPSARELAQALACGEQASAAIFACALTAAGVAARSMNGRDAGIHTTSSYLKADITRVDAKALLAALADHVVVVTGFQGVNADGELTTLGRGGSDLTAVALAAAVNAAECQIYTDVAGVYTADPRIVDDAQCIARLSYLEMRELASLGSKVLQRQAVEYAEQHGVLIRILSSFSGAAEPGTIVDAVVPASNSPQVSGIGVEALQTRFCLSGVSADSDCYPTLVQALATAQIQADMLMSHPHDTVQFVVPEEEAELTKQQLQRVFAEQSALPITASSRCAKVSVVGMGLAQHAGIAFQAMSLLAEHAIAVELVHSSTSKVSLVLAAERAEKAAFLLHQRFILA